MLLKIINIKDRVFDLLTRHVHLRDSDDRLIANIWKEDCIQCGYDIRYMSAYDFLKLLSEGKLTNQEAIFRARRRTQQKYVNLRGEKYNDRHIVESKIRENIDSI